MSLVVLRITGRLVLASYLWPLQHSMSAVVAIKSLLYKKVFGTDVSLARLGS